MGIDISFGTVGMNNVVYTTSNTQQLNGAPQFNSGLGTIIPARVKYIILDNSEEVNGINNKHLFNQFGDWSSIGTIFWEYIDNPITGSAFSQKQYATPIFPNIKNYPLVNEIIYLVQLPNSNIQLNLSSNSYYYFPPLNMWNSQIHNAIPGYDNNPTNNINQQVDYQEAFQGAVRQITDDSSEIYLGKTFSERIETHPLLPYEGDIIYEGRWGNSIRLGSTVNNAFIPNNWSSTGSNGDPLTIIRNGQAEYLTDVWIPVVEDINNDLSSIYLTSNQIIPLFASSPNNFSFSSNTSTPPTNVNQYSSNQIVLNSGRLVFNAKTDSIIALANKSIQLSCRETVGVDASKIALTADKIYLGSSEGTEGTSLQSAVLGENLIQQLSSLVTSLKSLATSVTNAVDSTGAPISDFIVVGTSLKATCDDILKVLDKSPKDNGSLLSNKIKIRQ
jgi:hypothetical protein